MNPKQLLLFCVLITVLLGCNKLDKGPDTKAPKLSLNGDNSIYVMKGEMGQDPGVKAIDNKDGDISQQVKSNWDSIASLNQLGTYIVTYSVADKANNIATIQRTVEIDFTAVLPLGLYTATLQQHPSCDGAVPPSYTLTGTAIFTTTAIKDNFVVNFSVPSYSTTLLSYTLIPQNNNLTAINVKSYVNNLNSTSGSAQIGSNTCKIFYSSYSRQNSINCHSNDELTLQKLP